MKKVISNFGDATLSREQMKEVKGGNEELGGGSCTAGCPNTGGATLSCTSTNGLCSKSEAHEVKQWIKCDGTKYDC